MTSEFEKKTFTELVQTHRKTVIKNMFIVTGEEVDRRETQFERRG